MQQPNQDTQANEQSNPNQDDYDIFVAQGIKLVRQAAESIKGDASIETLGSTLFEIVNKVETEGAKNGITFGIDVVLHGSNEILGHLIELSQVKINEEQIKAVIGSAVGKWVDNAVKTGKMTPEQLQEMVQQGQQSGQEMPEQQPSVGGNNGRLA